MHTKRSAHGSLTAALFISGLLSGCAFQAYRPQPIDPAQSAARYQTRDPASAEFRAYLIAQGYPANQLPLKQWGLRELTLSALFFHPQLDVARARWRAAQAGEITAGQRPDPGISGNIQNHSKTDGGISPWTYSLALDIPVETAGKRQARIDRATNLSEAARIEIGQTAWQVRSRLLNSLIEYNASLQQVQILQQELALRNEIVAMLQARFSAGLISSVEMANARLQLQKIQQSLQAEMGRTSELRAALANNAGLSLQTFSQLNLESTDSEHIIARPHHTRLARGNSADMQQAALLNRLDIRAALARYAAAEAKLRLEIARQYPDLVLSPGYSYDQGDRIWSLGLSALLNLLNKNQGLIAEARSLREVEAAQFEALQAQVIGDLEQNKARYFAALDELDKARQQLSAQLVSTQQIEHQFDAGYADRLELRTTQLENLLATKNLLSVEYKTQRAASALEDTLQRPLEDDASAQFSVPSDIEETGLNRNRP
ncbi:MAG: TolC family protein [Methylophilaceae bacterium]